MLVPPLNFGIVEENLYRCSKLETLNLSFIENLNLKIVVFIMSEDPGRPFKEFMKSRKIEWLVINPSSHLVTSSKDEKYNDVNSSDSSIEITPSTSGNNDNTKKNEVLNFESNQYINNENYLINNTLFLMHPKIIRMVFSIILDKSNNNILLVDKSALLVGMLRKIQKWQLSSIIDEYRMITGKHKSYNAECFLEFVKIELVQSKNSITNEDEVNSLRNNEEIKDEEEDEDSNNDAEKKYAEKRAMEHQKLQMHNKKNLSQLITNKLFETNDEDVSIHKSNHEEKLNILIEIDLENFNPPVPEYLVDIIDSLELEKDKLEKETAEELRKLDKQEEERKMKMRKKIKDINKYSMKFNKSKKETSQYEYYKSETKSRNTKISKKLIDINAINESIRKIKNLNEREANPMETELNKMKDSYEKRQQPFTRTKITFEPKPYVDKDEKSKNEALLNEYGIKFCDFPLSADDVSTSKKVIDDKQTVVINIPSENRLQSWFVHKRNIWEEDFVEENHREKIYV